MREFTLFCIVFALILLGGLVQISFSQSPSHDYESGKINAAGPMANTVKEWHFILQPNELREAVRIEESCLILMREMPLEVTLPFGRPFRIVLPVGTNYLIPGGDYEVKNYNNFVIEYRLAPAAECKQEK